MLHLNFNVEWIPSLAQFKILLQIIYACYIDDFLVYSRTVEEHYEHLKKFAALCLDHGIGLSADPKKCQICAKEIEFLGVVIREEKERFTCSHM